MAKSNRTRQRKGAKPDGTFNGYNIYFRNGTEHPLHSSVQCVGENYQDTGWMHRSCKFRHFCFDTSEQDFVIYQSSEEQRLQRAIEGHHFVDASTTMLNTSVAIGGLNSKWTWKRGIPRLRWFPKIIQGELREEYYELDPDVVWVPFHSLAAFNPGHLVWDEFLPVFAITNLFQLFHDHRFLLMRYILKGDRMWATCDFTEANTQACRAMYKKFLPLMGLTIDQFSTSEDFRLALPTSTEPPLICAAHGAAGFGMLTDHGMKRHGWERKDFYSMHNHGRGSLLFDFRNFMLLNLGLTLPNVLPTDPPYKIVFSMASSTGNNRDATFDKQISALRKHFRGHQQPDRVVIESYRFRDHSAEEQVRIAAETAIFVTVCGGGAVTATFLPYGATVILFYPEDGGVEGNHATGFPARLDWDLFNNLGYIRPHWLPISTMERRSDLDLFVKLVLHELDLISHQEY